MSESNKSLLSKALQAELGLASVEPGALFTDDVVGWSPIANVSGLGDAAELSAERNVAFSNVTIGLRSLDEVGNRAYAEWLVEADHTGPFPVDDGVVIEPTNRRVVLPGVTVADFRGGKIHSYRTYFDDVLLLEQLVDD
jgi:ketosteroid isomerase-like protein